MTADTLRRTLEDAHAALTWHALNPHQSDMTGVRQKLDQKAARGLSHEINLRTQYPAETHGAEPIGHVTSFGDLGCTCDYVSPQKYRPPVGAALYAIPPDLAADGERFRWLIDDRNWNENEDAPSVCTSEDVHWGDKARALIDRHMKKD